MASTRCACGPGAALLSLLHPGGVAAVGADGGAVPAAGHLLDRQRLRGHLCRVRPPGRRVAQVGRPGNRDGGAWRDLAAGRGAAPEETERGYPVGRIRVDERGGGTRIHPGWLLSTVRRSAGLAIQVLQNAWRSESRAGPFLRKLVGYAPTAAS